MTRTPRTRDTIDVFPDAAHRPSARDLPSLDGLRAISIGFVILGHACEGFVSPRVEEALAHLAHFGVCVFFTISGYLITSLLVRDVEKRGEVQLLRFYLRRTLRIFPPYYGYLAVAALAVSVRGWPEPVNARWWPALAYLSNFANTNWIVTGHGWSLSLEEQFYLTWPFVLTACIRRSGTRNGLRLAFNVALATLVVLPVVRAVVFGISRDGVLTGALIFDYVAAGSAIALLLADDRKRRGREIIAHLLSSSATPLLGIAALVLHVIFAASIRWKFAIDMTLITTAEAALLAVFVAWAVRNPDHVVGRLLNTRIVRVIGVGSYSLYLWQQLVFFGPPERATSASGLVARLVIAGLCAAASYFIVERPALQLRSRLEAALFPDPRTSE